MIVSSICLFFFFFFNDTATTEIYTLSLHDALPISPDPAIASGWSGCTSSPRCPRDRKSTRLNSSHQIISYAVFCLKKKKNTNYVRESYKIERNIDWRRADVRP